MDRMAINDLQHEYMAILEKAEFLHSIGVKNGICDPYNMTELKERVTMIRDYQSLLSFKANGYFEQLSEVTRLCGSVCCRLIVKPGSLQQFFACPSCPIYKFEESFVDD